MRDDVIRACYVDIKTVRTRRAAQLIFEIPLESYENAVKLLGAPLPDQEIWCAIARLRAIDKPERIPAGETALRQCHALCREEKFQQWLGADDEDGAGNQVRDLLRIASRSELLTNEAALSRWEELVEEFKHDQGVR